MTAGNSRVKVGDEFVCSRCGRRGQRGFMIAAGKAGEAPTILFCVSRDACAKREARAIRREAARGNWS